MQSESSYSREGYLHENFRYFHLRDNAGQERDYHFHEFDKIVVLISGSVTYMVEGTACEMQPGDVVLLSPACASFDQYSGYAERGEHFQREVHAL